jgi:hypothetical protein
MERVWIHGESSYYRRLSSDHTYSLYLVDVGLSSGGNFQFICYLTSLLFLRLSDSDSSSLLPIPQHPVFHSSEQSIKLTT